MLVTVVTSVNQDNRTAVEAEHDMSVFQISIQKMLTWHGSQDARSFFSTVIGITKFLFNGYQDNRTAVEPQHFQKLC